MNLKVLLRRYHFFGSNIQQIISLQLNIKMSVVCHNIILLGNIAGVVGNAIKKKWRKILQREDFQRPKMFLSQWTTNWSQCEGMCACIFGVKVINSLYSSPMFMVPIYNKCYIRDSLFFHSFFCYHYFFIRHSQSL